MNTRELFIWTKLCRGFLKYKKVNKTCKNIIICGKETCDEKPMFPIRSVKVSNEKLNRYNKKNKAIKLAFSMNLWDGGTPSASSVLSSLLKIVLCNLNNSNKKRNCSIRLTWETYISYFASWYWCLCLSFSKWWIFSWQWTLDFNITIKPKQ